MNDQNNLYDLIWMSRPLMQAAEASVEAGLADTELTVRMRAVLEILYRHGAAPVPDIAHHLDIKRQYTQVMVNEALAAGLIVKIENPRHKRSTLIDLTDKGRGLIQQVMERERLMIDELAKSFTETEIDVALRVVHRVVSELKSTTKDLKQ